MEDPDIQFKETTKALTAALGKELIPVATRLAAKLTELAPSVGKAARAFADLVEWALDRPKTALGIVIGSMIVKDIAAAAIGSKVRDAIVRAIGGAGTVPTGGAGGAGSRFGGVGTLAATAGAAGGVWLASDQASKLQKETGVDVTEFLPGFRKGTFDSDALIEDMAGGPRTAISRVSAAMGQLTPEHREAALNTTAQARALEAQLAAATKPPKVEGGEELKAAATALKSAASDLSKAQPNRTDKPSPVK